jgi:glyoxylase-like metal-dependent hydrolase (beta-lactamase superfamily II)
MIDSSSQDINYFSYQKITDGVYAAIANEHEGVFGNCGIIDIRDHTLILDTSESTKSAHELRQTAERLTGRPPSILVISHAHPDHTFGMKAFSDVPIIASTPILSIRPSNRRSPELEEYRLYSTNTQYSTGKQTDPENLITMK